MKANVVKLLAAGVTAAGAIAGSYLIAPWEGKKNEVYLDPIGIPTVCYGQTNKDLYGKQITLGMSYTDDECLIMLSDHIKKVESQVSTRVKVDFASDYQKASVISFVYNVGVGSFEKSTLLKKLNNGEHEAACEELTKWVFAGGRRLQGLANRREQEKQYCLGNVPQDVKVTYDEIVFSQIADSSRDQQQREKGAPISESTSKEEAQQNTDSSKSPSQSTYRCFFGWLECVRSD